MQSINENSLYNMHFFVVYGYHMQIRTKLRNMKIIKLNLTETFILYNAV